MEAQPLSAPAPAKYRFLGKLGEGGMAEVFVGVQDQASGFRKLLVLKVLRPALAEDRDGLAMFLDEARLAARLNHHNVVQTYEVEQLGDRHAIVMEFIEGAPLSRLRRLAQASGQRRGLPLAESIHILCEALSGLHYAHELRDFDGTPLHVVHRDFAPTNLMVTLDGHVKVLDFGVAKTRANVAHTRTGTIKGTTRYMAREVVLGQSIDRRTDVYMAGVTLWQMVTGMRPWDDKDELAVLVAIIEQRLPPVRELDPSLPAELESIILRATDPDPKARHRSAQELRDALLRFARGHGLLSDSDRLAALVRELAGPECEARRRSLDVQLSEPWTACDAALTPTLAVPSTPGLESSASRIRPTRTLSRLRRPSWLLAGGLLAVGTGLLAALVFSSKPARSARTDIRLTLEVPQSTPQGPPAAQAMELPGFARAPKGALRPQAPEPAQLRLALNVAAEPRHAALFLDGERLSRNPVELSVEPDDALHELRAEAPGYMTRVVQTRFLTDATLTLSLRPERVTKRRPPRRERKLSRAARRTLEPSPERAPDAASREPRVRSIDTESPFR